MNGGFVKATPESQGIPSAAVGQLIKSVKDDGMDIHSLHIFRNGYLVAGGCAKPYAEKKPRRIYSAAKSIVSLAVLFAVQEGLLNLDDAIISYFPDELPDEVSDYLASLRIIDMLVMSTGMEVDELDEYIHSNGQNDIVRSFFSRNITNRPGTVFFYNNAVPEILGILIQKVTGQTYVEYLSPRVIKPLDAFFTVQLTAQGWLNGSTTVSTILDLAKFTLLYLQGGMWEGRQLIDPDLIKLATTKQISTEGISKNNAMSHLKDECGYGFQLWMNQFGGFRLSGAFSQMGMAIPEENLAIVYTGMETRDIDSYIYSTIYTNLKQEAIHETKSAVTDRYEMEHMFLNWSSAPDYSDSAPEIESKYDGKVFSIDNNKNNITGITFNFSDRSLTIEQGCEKIKLAYGINGEFIENPRCITKTYTPQIIYGADSNISYLSAGWNNKHFLFEIRYAADMISDYFVVTFSNDSILVISESTLERLNVYGFGETPETDNKIEKSDGKKHRAGSTYRGTLR